MPDVLVLNTGLKEDLFKRKQELGNVFQAGLLIGCQKAVSDGDDCFQVFVACAIPCPVDEISSGKIDTQWYKHHAKQVARMIPGGLNIVGTYQIPTLENTSFNAFTLAKAIVPDTILNKTKCITRFASLQIDANNTYSYKVYRVSSFKSLKRDATLANIKESEVLARLSKVTTTVPLQVVLPVGLPKSGVSSKDRATAKKEAVELLCETMKDGISNVEPYLLVDPSTSKPIPLSSSLAPHSNVVVNIALKGEKLIISYGSNSDTAELMRIEGDFRIIAYVYGLVLVSEVKDALLEDIHRTLVSRLELLLEESLEAAKDLDGEDTQFAFFEKVNTVISTTTGLKLLKDETCLPRRVELTLKLLKDNTITLCDYSFPDEKTEEIMERVKELTGAYLTKDEFEIMEAEYSVASNTTNEQKVETENQLQKSNTIPGYIIVLILAILLALVFTLFFGKMPL